MKKQEYWREQGKIEAVLQERLSELKCSCQSIHEEEPSANPWLRNVLRFRGQKELTRKMAIVLIEKVIIYSGTAVKIEFRFSDAFRQLEETLSGKRESNSIANQRHLLREYVENDPELGIYQVMELCEMKIV